MGGDVPFAAAAMRFSQGFAVCEIVGGGGLVDDEDDGVAAEGVGAVAGGVEGFVEGR